MWRVAARVHRLRRARVYDQNVAFIRVNWGTNAFFLPLFEITFDSVYLLNTSYMLYRG